MGKYITPEEVQSFIGPDCDSLNAELLVGMSEALFNRLINSENGLISSEKTEYFDPKRDFGSPSKVGKVFLLRTYKPTAITSVNGVSPGTANVNYTLIGRRLEFEFAKEYTTTFPNRYTVVYTSGIASDAV